ncbi:MAG: sensor domain-containing protein [Chloroflexota bacterium]
MKPSAQSQWAKHFAIFREKQTWKNLLYLMLAFPLGLAYFIISVVGASVGIGLLIIWIGLFILLALFGVWWGMAAFERQLAIHLLNEDIAPMYAPALAHDGIADRFMSHFSNPVTWKSAAYLFLKFPIGIATFVTTTTIVSMISALVFAPFIYQTGDINILFWDINTFFDAILASGLGLFIAPLGFRVLNGLAEYSGKFANWMLSGNGISEKSPEDVLKTA